MLAPQIMPQISLIWFSSGLALAALLRWGTGVWPGIMLAAFFLAQLNGAPQWLALVLAAGNTAGPLGGAWALRRLNLRPVLNGQQDLWLFLSVGAGAAMLLTATNAAVWLWLGGLLASSQFVPAWIYWWLGNAIGVLIVGIPLLTFSPEAWRGSVLSRQKLGLLGLFSTVLAVGLLPFLPVPLPEPALAPLILVPHVLLCWLTLRSNLFLASIAVNVLVIGAAVATAYGHGPFFQEDMEKGVIALWVYAGTLCAMPLSLAALTGQLTSRDRQWELALESSNVGIAQWDVVTDEASLSPRWLRFLGYRTQTFGPSSSALWSRIHDEDRAAVRQTLLPLAAGTSSAGPFDFRMQRINGSWVWLQSNAVVTEATSDGKPLRIWLTARDISEQRAAEEKHLLSTKLFEHLHEGLLITDGAYRVLDANPKFCEIVGHTRDELLGIVPEMLRPAAPDSQQAVEQTQMQASLRERSSWQGELTVRHRNGDTRILHATVSAVKSNAGTMRFHTLAFSDITQSRRQLEQLERQAHFDELTGLPNRVSLASMLRDALQASEEEGFLLTVCYLDLDHFKAVNDKFGHAVGDFLLIELADRLRKSIRYRRNSRDVVARLGGDEFVLLLRSTTVDESKRAVERILRNISAPYGLGLGAGPLVVTSSIGATIYPIDNADADTLLRHADHAMYGAKQSGRNGFLFFDAEHDRRTEAHFEALGRVQEALEAEQFVLYFQPKVDMQSGKVLGVEALLRWKHPQHGVIPPAQFLPLIEHTSLSEQVGDWVLQHGIDQLARWQRMGLDLTVSINVSARHLQQPLFAKRLAALLDRHQTPVAQRLILEVLETAALADVDYTCELMEECKSLGVRFALDDFGTGYSTLTYLKRLPLDLLKIDRSFVHNMLNDAQDMAIVEGVIGLSGTFGCTVVAEGVESAEQALRLIEAGCRVGQGNGIARAMPAEDVFLWVRNYRGAPIGHDTQLPASPA
jgi:diguanylate cyclase (GGDEF)-like protein/PAS domain S-box-containing protein